MSFNRRTENSSFGGQGLASGVPRPGADGDRDTRDSAWRGSSGGTWSSSRNRSNRDEVDTVSDKFAAAFGRGGGGGRGEDRDRDRGSDRRGGREDPAPLKMNSRNFGEIAPREERPARGFGGDREGGFGGDREERPARGGFGGGDREDRPARGGFGGGDREDRPARGGFGGGDHEDRPARGGFGGGDREYRPRERRDEGGWEDDARFANKFSSGGRGGGDRRGGDRGGDRRGGDRGPSDYLPRRERDAVQGSAGREDFSAPLPTAPKSAAANSATVPKQSVFDMALANKGSKQNKPKKETKKETTESAPAPAAPVEVAAPVKPADSKAETREVVAAALSSGVKGAALSSSITSAYAAKDVTLPISLFAAVSAVLEHVAGVTGAFTSKWYKPDEYGAALKDIVAVRPVKEQVDALYAVQAYCAGLKFPKLDVNGKQKKLIEVIFTALLVSEVIDVDTILAWADDEVDRDVPGRVDAIVQMTTMLATLREPDEVEEEDFDADDLNRQYVK